MFCGLGGKDRQRRCGWLSVCDPTHRKVSRWMGHPCGVGWGGGQARQVRGRGVGWETVVVEKRISPLRRSKKNVIGFGRNDGSSIGWKSDSNGNSNDNSNS